MEKVYQKISRHFPVYPAGLYVGTDSYEVNIILIKKTCLRDFFQRFCTCVRVFIYLICFLSIMPNRRVNDLVTKMVSLGVSTSKAKSIVSGLSDAQIANALSSVKSLKAIIDVPT